MSDSVPGPDFGSFFVYHPPMEIISKGPGKYSYSDIKKAFRALWENKGVPTDLRLYMCGAVYQAGVKQGDEVFPREIFESILRGDELTQAELLAMVENVHKFVLVQDRLREQYLLIIVRMVTGYLDRQANQAVADLSREAMNN